MFCGLTRSRLVQMAGLPESAIWGVIGDRADLGTVSVELIAHGCGAAGQRCLSSGRAHGAGNCLDRCSCTLAAPGCVGPLCADPTDDVC